MSKSRGELSDLMVKWQCGASAKKKPMGLTSTSPTPPSDSGAGEGAVVSAMSLKMKTHGNKDFTEDRQPELGQKKCVRLGSQTASPLQSEPWLHVRPRGP